jgi:hypothetical protein
VLRLACWTTVVLAAGAGGTASPGVATDATGGVAISFTQRSYGTIALARIHDIFGPGKSAEMTYYTTKAGAKVFSAGVMNFGGSAEWPVVSRLIENLWDELTRA